LTGGAAENLALRDLMHMESDIHGLATSVADTSAGLADHPVVVAPLDEVLPGKLDDGRALPGTLAGHGGAELAD